MKGHQSVVLADLQVAVLGLHHLDGGIDAGNGGISIVVIGLTEGHDIVAQTGDLASLGIGLDAFHEPVGRLHGEVLLVGFVCSYD